MQIIRILIIVCFLLLSGLRDIQGQCTGGINGGALSPPTGIFQTTSVSSGSYYTFNAVSGCIYLFSFCQGGGTAAFNTELTMLDNAGAYAFGYNDDNCGQLSELWWWAPASGTYRILVNTFSCLNTGATGTMAYQAYPPWNDDPCISWPISITCAPFYNFISFFCANSSTGVPPPGCGFYSGGDTWYSVVVPATGNVTLNTQSGTLTDLAMAAYSGACGSLVLLSCDDNSGPGNMPMLSMTGLTPGATLYIRIWDNNNDESGDFYLAAYDTSQPFCLNGTATDMGGGCTQLTPIATNQMGCAWNTTQVDLSFPFSFTNTVYLGANDAGADGICFILQTQGTGYCGGVGGGAMGYNGLTPSLGIEIDTWDNGVLYGDIPADHIAVNLGGNMASPVCGPVQASAVSVNVEDGNTHNFQVTWDPGTMTIQIFFDGSLRISCVVDLAAHFGASPVNWGFTGTTGAGTNQQYFCPINILATNLENFSAEPIGPTVNLSWEHQSSEEIRHFIIERKTKTNEGIEIGRLVVNAFTNGSFSLEDQDPLEGKSFYRLVTHSINGGISYSSWEEVAFYSEEEFSITPIPNPGENDLSVFVHSQSKGVIDFILIDGLGNEVWRSTRFSISENSTIALKGLNLSPGIYFVNANFISEIGKIQRRSKTWIIH